MCNQQNHEIMSRDKVQIKRGERGKWFLRKEIDIIKMDKVECLYCGSDKDLSELDFKGSGKYICEECKFKEV